MAFAMVKYATPNESALHSRKKFYSNIKDINETVQEWYHRIEESIYGCDFGALSHVMLIDKFVSGLDNNLFGQLAKATTLTVDQILSIAANDGLSYDSFESVKTEPDFGDFLSVDLIKNEDADDLMFDNEFDAGNSNEYIEPRQNELVEKIPKQQKHKKKVKKVIEKKDNKNKDESNIAVAADEIFNIPVKLKGSILNDKKHTVCLDCGKIFVQRSSYVLHSRLHSGINLHICKVCSKPCLTRGKLRRHILTHEMDGRSFECYLCPSKFNRFFALKSHLNVKHSLLKKDELTCTYCDRKFFNPRTFEIHLNVHKGITDAHQCPHCDKKFYTRPRLLAHVKIHSDYREFVCETCGARFRAKKDLKSHILKHTGEKPFKCTECGMMLKSRSTYKNHLRLHTGERPYSCEMCSRTFTQRANLKKHIMVHNKERPHVCTMCPKRFTASCDLRVHMCVHTGDKPHKCTVCDKAFTQRGTLRMHIAKVHTNVI